MTTTSMVSSSTGSRSVASSFLDSRPRQTGPAAVYILQRSDRLRFKLGWSNDPLRRARQLPEFDKGLLDLPQSWALWLPNPGRALQIEQSLHRGLTPYRVSAGHEDTGHTEWFSPRVLVPAMRLLGEMPSGDRHGRTLALRPVLQPGPETVDIASGDCTAMDTWFALEDLWLRLAACRQVVVEREDGELRLVVREFKDALSGTAGELRGRVHDLTTYRWHQDGHGGSFMQLMHNRGKDLVCTLTPTSVIGRWPEGADLVWQFNHLLARLSQ
jgi:hypothetical protein